MRFSIIIPCYNVANYLEATLGSVLRQTFDDWECVCVDDGSTDATAEILDAKAALDRRIVIIHQANCGEGGARNAGIAKAAGEYLLFLDGDDVLHEEALSRCNMAIQTHPGVDGVCFEKIRSEEPLFTPLNKFECRKIDTTAVIEDKQFLWAYVWQHVYRRDLMADVKFREYVMSEDATYVANYLTRARTACIIPDKLYGYRVRKGSIMNSSITPRKWFDSLHAYHEIVGLLKTSAKKYNGDYVHAVSFFLVIAPIKRLRHFNLFEIVHMIQDWRSNVGVLRLWKVAPFWLRLVACVFGARIK